MATISDPQSNNGLSPERRARILAGATTVFVAQGYEGASMSQIAALANVSKGTLYNYFPSKEELFAAFVWQHCDQFVLEIFGDPQVDAPLDTELSRIGRVMLKMMVSPTGQAVFRVVVMEAAKFPDLAKAFMAAGPQATVNRLAAWLAAQNQAGRLTTPDPQFAAEQFFALNQARLVMRVRVDPSYQPTSEEIEHVVNGAVEVFLAAYATSGINRRNQN
jgi:TetR/AcrR family transcriptional regulator, mexJK operon transcriptional repressor